MLKTGSSSLVGFLDVYRSQLAFVQSAFKKYLEMLYLILFSVSGKTKYC